MAVERDEPDELLVVEMGQRTGRVWGVIARAANVPFGNDAEGANSGERSTLVPVQLIPIVSVEHDLTVQLAGQVDVVKKRVASISAATAMITSSVATGVVTIMRVVAALGGRAPAQRHPAHVNLARVAVAVTRIDLVEHTVTSSQ
jgi:hypothetical protein